MDCVVFGVKSSTLGWGVHRSLQHWSPVRLLSVGFGYFYEPEIRFVFGYFELLWASWNSNLQANYEMSPNTDALLIEAFNQWILNMNNFMMKHPEYSREKFSANQLTICYLETASNFVFISGRLYECSWEIAAILFRKSRNKKTSSDRWGHSEKL